VSAHRPAPRCARSSRRSFASISASSGGSLGPSPRGSGKRRCRRPLLVEPPSRQPETRHTPTTHQARQGLKLDLSRETSRAAHADQELPEAVVSSLDISETPALREWCGSLGPCIHAVPASIQALKSAGVHASGPHPQASISRSRGESERFFYHSKKPTPSTRAPPCGSAHSLVSMQRGRRSDPYR
jgi:hypothetical protein